MVRLASPLEWLHAALSTPGQAWWIGSRTAKIAKIMKTRPQTVKTTQKRVKIAE
jgi:hypothetical protein